MASSIVYTFRCPVCRRDRDTFSAGYQFHEHCPVEGTPKPMVLVAIDGVSVASGTDPKPAGQLA